MRIMPFMKRKKGVQFAGAGASDYDDLSNKPQIGGVTLTGNKTLADLGVQSVLTFDNTPTENSSNPVKSGGVWSELNSKTIYEGSGEADRTLNILDKFNANRAYMLYIWVNTSQQDNCSVYIVKINPNGAIAYLSLLYQPSGTDKASFDTNGVITVNRNMHVWYSLQPIHNF